MVGPVGVVLGVPDGEDVGLVVDGDGLGEDGVGRGEDGFGLGADELGFGAGGSGVAAWVGRADELVLAERECRGLPDSPVSVGWLVPADGAVPLV